MEHRWGMRRTLDVGVELYAGPGQPRLGRILNASSSGAYVATSAPLSTMTRVRVAIGRDRFHRNGSHRIAAYVVRADRCGIGIEWQEFAPPAVLALMESLETALRQNTWQAPPRGNRLLVTGYAARSTGTQQSAGFEAHG